jgi:Protein of unknown function (DUF3307)
MTETFAALLFAHVLADFGLQPAWMAFGKADRRPLPFLAHIAVVAATAVAATGSLAWPVAALILAHTAIDLGKVLIPAPRLASFLADQSAHLATLVAVTIWAPGLYAWTVWPGLAPLMALAAGILLATRAGGFAVGILMEPWAEETPVGLRGAGRTIGILERALVFLFVVTNQAEGIGFLIAAKSVLRFGAVGDDRKISEYVIIGTLASFGWAIAAAVATLALLSHLPPLGIPDLSP